MYQPFVPEQQQIQAFLAARLRLLDESGLSLAAEATFFFRNHKSTSMLEMPQLNQIFRISVGLILIFCTATNPFSALALTNSGKNYILC